MAEVLLFHHALGLTSGVLAFADELRRAGHAVHTPDLYEGHTFGSVEEGVAHAREAGFETILERGVRAADGLSAGLVYAGFSLGVMPAQKLAQARAGARGALFFHGCLPAEEFGEWPSGLPVQIHAMDRDPWFEEDVEAARALVSSEPGAELFLYAGAGHLFTDSSAGEYDAVASALVLERVLKFLEGR